MLVEAPSFTPFFLTLLPVDTLPPVAGVQPSALHSPVSPSLVAPTARGGRYLGHKGNEIIKSQLPFASYLFSMEQPMSELSFVCHAFISIH